MLLSAQACALTANRMLLVAVPWLVLTSTGSAALTALVVLCQTLPYVVMQVVTGPLLDRVGPRRVAGSGDLISAAAMTVLAASGTAPVWLLATAMAVIGAADGPASAAKSVLLPAVTAEAGQPIERGTGLATAVERAATTAGPALAGLLIAAYGTPCALWISAVLFAAGSLFAALVHTSGVAPGAGGGYGRRLRHGAAFLHQDHSLRALIVMFVITNLLDQGFLSVLLPVWARAGGHGAGFVGLAVSVFAGAAVFTALLAAAIGDRLPRRSVYLIGFITAGVSRIVAVALDLPPTLVLVVFAVAGLGSGAANPIIEAVQYERIPPELLSRVRTLIGGYAWAGIPAGGIAGAGLLTVMGLPAALGVCATVYLAAVVYPGWRVTWRSRS